MALDEILLMWMHAARVAAYALVRLEQYFGFRKPRFRVVTPHTAQRTPLHEERRPYAGPVVDGIPLDVENHRFHAAKVSVFALLCKFFPHKCHFNKYFSAMGWESTRPYARAFSYIRAGSFVYTRRRERIDVQGFAYSYAWPHHPAHILYFMEGIAGSFRVIKKL